jgi:hypothetical protein
MAAVANGMVLLATMTTGAGGSAPPFLRPGSSPTGPPIPLRPFIQLWVAAPLADVPSASARPGHSEHQLGTALDLGADGARAPWEQHFSRTAQGRWVTAHAWEFGFLVSYTPGARARTCYSAEAWHVRYVGRAETRAVHESGLTLRE